MISNPVNTIFFPCSPFVQFFSSNRIIIDQTVYVSGSCDFDNCFYCQTKGKNNCTWDNDKCITLHNNSKKANYNCSNYSMELSINGTDMKVKYILPMEDAIEFFIIGKREVSDYSEPPETNGSCGQYGNCLECQVHHPSEKCVWHESTCVKKDSTITPSFCNLLTESGTNITDVNKLFFKFNHNDLFNIIGLTLVLDTLSVSHCGVFVPISTDLYTCSFTNLEPNFYRIRIIVEEKIPPFGTYSEITEWKLHIKSPYPDPCKPASDCVSCELCRQSQCVWNGHGCVWTTDQPKSGCLKISPNQLTKLRKQIYILRHDLPLGAGLLSVTLILPNSSRSECIIVRQSNSETEFQTTLERISGEIYLEVVFSPDHCSENSTVKSEAPFNFIDPCTYQNCLICQISGKRVCHWNSGCSELPDPITFWNQTNSELSNEIFPRCLNETHVKVSSFGNVAIGFKHLLPSNVTIFDITIDTGNSTLICSIKSKSSSSAECKTDSLLLPSNTAYQLFISFVLSDSPSKELAHLEKVIFEYPDECLNFSSCLDCLTIGESCNWDSFICTYSTLNKSYHCQVIPENQARIVQGNRFSFLPIPLAAYRFKSLNFSDDKSVFFCNNFNYELNGTVWCELKNIEPGKYVLSYVLKRGETTHDHIGSTNWKFTVYAPYPDPCAAHKSCSECQMCATDPCKWENMSCVWNSLVATQSPRCLNIQKQDFTKIRKYEYSLKLQLPPQFIVSQITVKLPDNKHFICKITNKTSSEYFCDLKPGIINGEFQLQLEIKSTSDKCGKVHIERPEFLGLIPFDCPYKDCLSCQILAKRKCHWQNNSCQELDHPEKYWSQTVEPDIIHPKCFPSSSVKVTSLSKFTIKLQKTQIQTKFTILEIQIKFFEISYKCQLQAHQSENITCSSEIKFKPDPYYKLEIMIAPPASPKKELSHIEVIDFQISDKCPKLTNCHNCKAFGTLDNCGWIANSKCIWVEKGQGLLCEVFSPTIHKIGGTIKFQSISLPENYSIHSVNLVDKANSFNCKSTSVKIVDQEFVCLVNEIAIGNYAVLYTVVHDKNNDWNYSETSSYKLVVIKPYPDPCNLEPTCAGCQVCSLGPCLWQYGKCSWHNKTSLIKPNCLALSPEDVTIRGDRFMLPHDFPRNIFVKEIHLKSISGQATFCPVLRRHDDATECLLLINKTTKFRLNVVIGSDVCAKTHSEISGWILTVNSTGPARPQQRSILATLLLFLVMILTILTFVIVKSRQTSSELRRRALAKLTSPVSYWRGKTIPKQPKVKKSEKSDTKSNKKSALIPTDNSEFKRSSSLLKLIEGTKSIENIPKSKESIVKAKSSTLITNPTKDKFGKIIEAARKRAAVAAYAAAHAKKKPKTDK